MREGVIEVREEVAQTDGFPKLIGFAGPAGAGKTTACVIIMERFGAVKVSFADPLRAMMHFIGVDPHDRDGKELPNMILCGKSPRYAMQTLGTEWGRDTIGEELWVRSWISRQAMVRAHGKHVVCEDVRFPNEVDAIKSQGGTLVYIDGRGGIDGSHPSEGGVTPEQCDIVIDNSGPELVFLNAVIDLWS